MKRILLTGMSATGKSTLVRELAARGYKAIDLDHPDWSEFRPASGGPGEEPWQEWVWQEDRVRELLATNDAEVLFVSGCASNQGRFYPQLDHVVLLSAPTPVLIERLATRTTNDFGKRSEELARILGDIEAVEPRLRRGATLELDTSAPLEQVVSAVLVLVEN